MKRNYTTNKLHDYKTLTTVIKSKNNDEITLFSTKIIINQLRMQCLHDKLKPRLYKPDFLKF